jgi:hypothetical protein
VSPQSNEEPYLFTYSLFNDAVGTSVCRVSNGRIISVQRIENYMDGSGGGLIWGTVPEFFWGLRKTKKHKVLGINRLLSFDTTWTA